MPCYIYAATELVFLQSLKSQACGVERVLSKGFNLIYFSDVRIYMSFSEEMFES